MSPLTPPLPSPGSLIPSAGPSVLWVTITHIHVTPGPFLPCPGPGAAGDAFVGRGGQRLPGLGAPAVSPPPGWTMGRFVREGTGSGKQSSSHFQVQRDERSGEERGSPAVRPAERLGDAVGCAGGWGWAICAVTSLGPRAAATPGHALLRTGFDRFC